MKATINQQEAGAFALHAKMAGMSTAQALAEIGRTTWPDTHEDLAFGRRRHLPTIRRLARALVGGLDAENAWRASRQADEEADKVRFAALPAETKAAIRAAVATAHHKKSNRAARDFARSQGITVHAETIEALRTLAA